MSSHTQVAGDTGGGAIHAPGSASIAGNGDGLSLQFDSGPEAASAARSALAAIEPQLAPEPMNDVRLLVSELVTNSIRHSSGEAHSPVTLDVALSEDKLRVEVTDRGSGFEPHSREPGQSKASGWGLYLVEHLSDRWGVIRNHITRVWFEIDHPSTAPARART